MKTENLTDEQKKALELQKTLKELCYKTRKEYFKLSEMLSLFEEATATPYNDDCEVKTLRDYCIDVALPSTGAMWSAMRLLRLLEKIDKIIDEA